MENYDDLKVCEFSDGKIMAVMDKKTWKTICDIIAWASKISKEKKKEAGLY